mmetsp:Transcript_35516/g.91323  ORF Transcript_35516/g.91323 Transcript_35516/m.91323 type:complete len:421 (+) Transcript_35516:221-1483(+)
MSRAQINGLRDTLDSILAMVGKLTPRLDDGEAALSNLECEARTASNMVLGSLQSSVSSPAMSEATAVQEMMVKFSQNLKASTQRAHHHLEVMLATSVIAESMLETYSRRTDNNAASAAQGLQQGNIVAGVRALAEAEKAMALSAQELGRERSGAQAASSSRPCGAQAASSSRPRTPAEFEQAQRAIDRIFAAADHLKTRINSSEATLGNLEIDLRQVVLQTQARQGQSRGAGTREAELGAQVHQRLCAAVQKLQQFQQRADKHADNVGSVIGLVDAMTQSTMHQSRIEMKERAPLSRASSSRQTSSSMMLPPPPTASMEVTNRFFDHSPASWPARSSGQTDVVSHSPPNSWVLRIHGEQWSEGSLKHPQRCTPCNFFCFSSQGCSKGASCQYCHQKHVSKANMQRKSRIDYLSGLATSSD